MKPTLAEINAVLSAVTAEMEVGIYTVRRADLKSVLLTTLPRGASLSDIVCEIGGTVTEHAKWLPEGHSRCTDQGFYVIGAVPLNIGGDYIAARLGALDDATAAWELMFEEFLEKHRSQPADRELDHAYLAKRFNIDETNLWLLAEESGEVVRGCGKIGRWGYDHVHQVTGESGMRLLESEIGDFLAIVEIMIARGHFTREAIHDAVHAKLARLEEWYEPAPTPADLETINPATGRPTGSVSIDGGEEVLPLPLDALGRVDLSAIPERDIKSVASFAGGQVEIVTCSRDGRVRRYSGVSSEPLVTTIDHKWEVDA